VQHNYARPTNVPDRRLRLVDVALPNLTRDEAAERAALVTVDSYRIVLDLTDGNGAPSADAFRSTTTVEFSALAGADTVIDIAARSIHSATLNGVELDVSGYDESTGIALTGLAERNVLVVDADCLYSNTGEGLHRFVDPVDDEVYLYSQFETADAKRMFACFDQPDLKATFDVSVTAPAHWQVISNGATTSVEDGVHTFATTPRMSTYLVALIAGAYARWDDVYSDEHGDIPLGIFCRASLGEFMDAERLFTETKQGFGFYHQNFGVPYAFGKYDQLFVPEFNAGAMENAGAVTFLEDYVFRSKVTRYSYERRAETVLHEMAHMWFGDLVTMTWWDDLWLNESFATFASVLCQADATEYKQAWTTFANVEKSWAYRQDQLPSTHPVAADIPDLAAVEVNFDGITYAKGASVLKQLVAYVGLEAFLAGLRDYFRDHAFANATFGDLLGALEKSSGRDLSHWGRQWLKTTGLNTLRADFDVDAEGAFTQFSITQGGAAPGAGETRVHRLAVGVYDDDGTGKLVRTHREELDVEGERTDVPALQGISRGKFILVNDDDLTYCSLRLDPDSLSTVMTRIADIAEPLPRTLAWSAAWEMTRDAELKARDFVELVKAGLRRCATRPGTRVRPWFGPSAGVRQCVVQLRAVHEPHRGAVDAAGQRTRSREPLRSGDRHRSALADRDRPGRQRKRRCRRSGDTVHRRRVPAGPDGGRQAPRRSRLGGPAAGGGQGRGVAPGHRGRHDCQHHHALDRDRLRSARPGRAAGAVHREVLCRHRRCVGAAVQRGRPDRGHRALPVV
jgi:aminopeptidase N